MTEETPLAISFKYESRTLFRNVRPLSDILDDFKTNNILHVHIDPEEIKYGSWNLVIAFAKQENYDLFVAGQLSPEDLWKADKTSEQHRVNPLKAAKRAAAG